VSSTGYNPKEYWLSRGKVYKNEFKYDAGKRLQEEMLLEYLKSIAPFPAVLELGCGFGRITQLITSNFPEIEEYVATDLSPDQLENAKSYVKSSEKIRFIESDIQSLELPAHHFDLVIAAEVLLHVLPVELDTVISKLASLSKNHVINIDYYEENPPERRLAAHNFIHDYEAAYKGIPSVANVRRISIAKKKTFSTLDTKQSIFHALVRHS
jgi:ubiquinone/menaquinone biosynthesis C-methylase UbiE